MTGWTFGQERSRVPDQLTCVGASPGVAVDRVKVLRGLHAVSQLTPGDVLVCAHPHPAWAALFSIAAALVIESRVSSRIANGVVIAWEYGLLTVIARGDATSVLQDDKLVAVDGVAGIVWRRSSSPG